VGHRGGRFLERASRRPCLLALFFLLFLAPSILQGQASEHDVKARFLERICRFIDWPAGAANADPARPFLIGVLGEFPASQANPFGSALERALGAGFIKGKKGSVQYVSNLRDLERFDALFIAGTARAQLPQILAATRQKAILTIGDTPGFGEAGVHINFFVSESKIRFELNESALRESRLKVDSLLLGAAQIVRTKERSP